jgi:hypothetical protein
LFEEFELEEFELGLEFATAVLTRDVNNVKWLTCALSVKTKVS